MLAADREVSSDIAFWGKYAFHGNYDGFRIVDVSAPGNPKLVSHTRCNGDQGDIYVWEHLVVHSWNSPAPLLEDGTSGRFCDGEPVPRLRGRPRLRHPRPRRPGPGNRGGVQRRRRGGAWFCRRLRIAHREPCA